MPQTFSHPFSAGFWRCAAQELKKPRVLALAALFIALDVAISALFIPVPGAQNLRIYFTFLVKGLGGVIYGPIVGMLTGFIGDIAGFMLHPSGGFFPGYTLTAILSGLFYGLFFYRAKVGIVRIILCKFSVNLLINVCLGSVWSAMLYEKGYIFYLTSSIVKNGLLLPVEAAMLFAFFGVIFPVLSRMNFLPRGSSILRRRA